MKVTKIKKTKILRLLYILLLEFYYKKQKEIIIANYTRYWHPRLLANPHIVLINFVFSGLLILVGD